MTDSISKKLSLREKFCYGLGDFGSNLLLCVGTLYLLKFYTDELNLPAYYGGIIFLVAKFSTAFTDMLTGFLLDGRTSIGKRGKFRPFILIFSIPCAIVASVQFLGNDFSLPVKTAIVTVLFLFFGLFYSLMNCSYGAMVPAITQNPVERASLAAWRQGGSTVGLLCCTVLFIPLQQLMSGHAHSFFIAATIFSVAGWALLMCCYHGVRERYVVVDTSQRSSLLKSFGSIFQNKPLLILCLANLCTLAAFNIKLAVQVYYTQYVLHDVSILSLMGFFSMGMILVGVCLVPAAVGRFGKIRVYVFGLTLWAVGDLINFIVGLDTIWFVIFSCVAYFGTAFANSLNWALVPDTVDYGEWKTGIRAEGKVYTGYTFSRKIAAGLAGFLPGMLLTLIGYVPNVEQTADTILGMRSLMFIIPAALAVIAALSMSLFYHLDEKRFALIMRDLILRRANKTGNAATGSCPGFQLSTGQGRACTPAVPDYSRDVTCSYRWCCAWRQDLRPNSISVPVGPTGHFF